MITEKEFKLPVEAVEVLTRLHNAGFEAYVIGGAVRSHLLGLPADDIDIVSNASEEAVCSLFPASKVIGKAFGVVQVQIGKKTFEVARYRTESGYADGRHPSTVEFPDNIAEDINRRDFTCNALYYDYRKDEIIDLVGGIDDIQNRILRCIGNPIERLIKEDCLRMLRAVRFATKLGFALHKDTFDVIRKNASHILRISSERIAEELNKILLSENVYWGLHLLVKTNLMQAVLPEVALCVNFGQHNTYHQYDLFEHTAQTMKGLKRDFYALTEKEQLIVKLSLLLHDTGKPYSCTVKKINCTYTGHPDVSAEIAQAALKRLKYSREITEQVTLLVKCHDYIIPETPKACKKLLNALGEDLFRLWRIIKRQDVKAHSDYGGVKATYVDKLKNLDKLYANVKNDCFTLSGLAINGRDLIDSGFEGAAIGKMLNGILQLVLDDELPNEREALLNYAVQKREQVVL